MKTELPEGGTATRRARSRAHRSPDVETVIQRDSVEEASTLEPATTAEVQGQRVGSANAGELAGLETDPLESEARAEAEGADGSDPPFEELDPERPKDLVDLIAAADAGAAEP